MRSNNINIIMTDYNTFSFTVCFFFMKAILSAKQLGIENEFKIPGCNLTVQNSCTTAQLMKLRRQFLTYSKMQQIEINQIASLFVQYLNKSL